MNGAQPESIEAYRADLRRRLRDVCADWPDERFAQLIDRMVAVEMKYRERARLDIRGADVIWPKPDTK